MDPLVSKLVSIQVVDALSCFGFAGFGMLVVIIGKFLFFIQRT
jgi:hypothetical protein